MSARFTFVRPETRDGVPKPSPAFVDVHVLDMNHGWHNAGHDSIVWLVRRLAKDEEARLTRAGVTVRLISYDVRRRILVPEAPRGIGLHVGTGGPGHLDPRLNRRDDVDAGEILESDAWETPLFEFFDAVKRDERAMFYGVCHSFGLLCRWSGVARPVRRTPAQGGASIGIVENVLTPQALAHPWFARLSSQLTDGRRLPIVDSRHYDLIPEGDAFPPDVMPIAYESAETGAALTMCEFARKPDGTPRIFAVNHHPEIADAAELGALLQHKLDSGEVSREWYESRAGLIGALQERSDREELRLLAAGYSFGFLLRDGLREAIDAATGSRRGSTISNAL